MTVADSKLISSGSDWDFETLAEYDQAIAELAHGKFGLDTYPNQIEVISSEQMMDAYSSVGMPVGYNHWSFGKQFVEVESRYRRGQMGLAYEIVINSNPCIAYLMEENTITMQALVIAHAGYGHNSFFKGNYLFKTWTDASAIIDYLVFARHYLAECEQRHGVTAVEETANATGKRPCNVRSRNCGKPFPTCSRWCSAASPAGASPPSPRKTCSTSWRRTRRYWSPGSAR